MDSNHIKREIKEEIIDELIPNVGEDFDLSLSQRVKIENEFDDELSNYEYAEPESSVEECSTIIDERENGNHLNVYTAKASASRCQQTTIEYENVYVDGEPEVSIDKFKTLMNNHSKAVESDPLALHTTTPFDERENQLDASDSDSMPECKRKMIKVHLKKVVPIKNLVNRTYSKSADGTNNIQTKYLQYECDVCFRSFSNTSTFQQHRDNCYVKCNDCNLIFKVREALAAHIDEFCSKRVKRTIPTSYPTRLQPFKRPKISKPAQPCSSSSKSCNICCIELESVEQLEEHRKQNHFMPNAYACHLCDKKFDSNPEARSHLKRDH